MSVKESATSVHLGHVQLWEKKTENQRKALQPQYITLSSLNVCVFHACFCYRSWTPVYSYFTKILHWKVEAEFPNQMLCWQLKWLKNGVMLQNKGSLEWEAAKDYFFWWVCELLLWYALLSDLLTTLENPAWNSLLTSSQPTSQTQKNVE